jgi:hypothetical protein
MQIYFHDTGAMDVAISCIMEHKTEWSKVSHLGELKKIANILQHKRLPLVMRRSHRECCRKGQKLSAFQVNT